jgi:mannose-1-phosphate guanylyltransferase
MITTDSHGFSSSLWGIVLAGGDGTRLEPFVRKLRGDDLPKQFVNFIGRRSMLEHTFDRAEKLISKDRLFTVISREHLKFPEVKQQIAGRVRDTIVVQPENKDTLPGVLLPLLHVYHRDPLATVVVLPSDHFVLEEDRFVNYLCLACRTIERKPASMVLLGVEPDNPEDEYGYILPDEEAEGFGDLKVRRVSSFIEKPAADEVPKLLERGALWNTMAMVFKAITLLHLTARISPSLHTAFERIGRAIGTKRERQVVTEAYRRMDRVNFSTELLELLPETRPSSLLTLPVEKVLWSDWGSPRRVVGVLSKTGFLARVRNLSERRLLTIWADQDDARKRRTIRRDGAVLQIR